jgi:hypothetical protein
MIAFQWASLTVLGLCILSDLRRFWRGSTARGLLAARLVVWSIAAAAIARPDLTSIVATSMGIGRGTDLVLYLFVLAFIATTFYFYSRYQRLQRQITELVRQQAIREAQFGEDRHDT